MEDTKELLMESGKKYFLEMGFKSAPLRAIVKVQVEEPEEICRLLSEVGVVYRNGMLSIMEGENFNGTKGHDTPLRRWQDLRNNLRLFTCENERK